MAQEATHSNWAVVPDHGADLGVIWHTHQMIENVPWSQSIIGSSEPVVRPTDWKNRAKCFEIERVPCFPPLWLSAPSWRVSPVFSHLYLPVYLVQCSLFSLFGLSAQFPDVPYSLSVVSEFGLFTWVVLKPLPICFPARLPPTMPVSFLLLHIIKFTVNSYQPSLKFSSCCIQNILLDLIF